jgi:hypothetical protein
MESDLKRISLWLKFHYLFPNPSKTKYLTFKNKRSHNNSVEIPLNVAFNGTIIERVVHTRLLGLEIDENLTFSYHIHQIQSKIISFTYALKRMRAFISENTALTLYFAYIQSRLIFMNVIWAAAPKYLIDSLEIIQRKALRIVYNKPRLCSGSELYSVKVLPVSDLCKVFSSLLVFKMTNNTAKILLNIQYAHQGHRYPTRSSNNFVISFSRTQFGSMNFFIRAFSEFNNLPVSIKEHVSLGHFKSQLKEFYFEKFMMRYSN